MRQKPQRRQEGECDSDDAQRFDGLKKAKHDRLLYGIDFLIVIC